MFGCFNILFVVDHVFIIFPRPFCLIRLPWGLVLKNVELGLDKVTAFSDILGRLHLISRKHPHLDIGSEQVSDSLRNFIL